MPGQDGKHVNKNGPVANCCARVGQILVYMLQSSAHMSNNWWLRVVVCYGWLYFLLHSLRTLSPCVKKCTWGPLLANRTMSCGTSPCACHQKHAISLCNIIVQHYVASAFTYWSLRSGRTYSTASTSTHPWIIPAFTANFPMRVFPRAKSTEPL